MLLRSEQVGLGGRWGNRPKHVDIMRCDRCGEEYRLKHRSVNDKALTFCSKTCLARSDVMLEQKKMTCVERYGVPFVSQVGDVKQKKHLTRKQNGTYGMSYAEGRFYTFLCDHYGSDAVERQVIVNGWSIDFYIKSTKTWVQFDGVYWHGLMYAYSELTVGQRVVYDKDRAQDSWFLARGMQLVRITDTDLVESETSGDWSKIETKLGAH